MGRTVHPTPTPKKGYIEALTPGTSEYGLLRGEQVQMRCQCGF